MYLFSKRGVRMEQHKTPSLIEKIDTLPLCSMLTVPLYTLGKTQLKTTVDIGGEVLKYAPLAVSPSKRHAIISPASGTLADICTMVHPILGKVPCAVIKTSKIQKESKTVGHNGNMISADDLIMLAKAAGITDEYDGLPLYRKLRAFAKEQPAVLVAAAIDDDPYVTSGIAALLENGEEVVDGLRLAAKVTGICQLSAAVFCAEEMPKGLEIPEEICGVSVLKVKGKYPVWHPLALQLNANRQSRDNTVQKIGVQACAALSRAVRKGLPQTEMIVTVAGDAVQHWRNLRVPIGTPIEHILQFAGVCRLPNWVIMGSTMTGSGLSDTAVPMIGGVRAVTAFARREWAKHYSCIGCGRCIQVCPQKLMPYFIAQLSERGEYQQAQRFGADQCIQCGACAAVCPSGVELTAAISAVNQQAVRREHDWGDNE